jgi:hypothetical protein
MVQLEDPIPTNGNPHPWLALTEDVNQQGNGFLHPDWQPVNAEHQVGSPQPPPGSLVQLNSIPAEQGVNAGDGSVPENNVYDDLEDEGFNFEDLEDAGLDFGHIVSGTDSTDDQLVLMNVQHAISLSDALAAAIAEVQLNPFSRSERTVVHPIWGPMPNPAENPLAIVPFVPAPPPPEEVTAAAIIADEAESSTAAASRKCRRQIQVSVESLRRSPRSNKYQGFKQPITSDRVERKSHVKPSHALTITPPPGPESDRCPVNQPAVTDEEENQDSDAPPPTPIMLLQHVAINLCGVPEEEITQEALQAVEEEDGQVDKEENAEP